MKILVLGGNRYFGVHLVNELIKQGHEVTIANRGRNKDSFGDRVNRAVIERSDGESLRLAFSGKKFDVIYDNICFSSNNVKQLLENVECDRYIVTSSASVYYDFHIGVKEEEVNPLNNELKWCNQEDYPFDEIKRQAENALFNYYKEKNAVAVRFPLVMGIDDYTKRLYFYVDHIVNKKPMNINNMDSEIGFISSDMAGKFLAFLADNKYQGVINAACDGVVTIKDIISYTEKKSNIKAILTSEAEEASLNSFPNFSLDNTRAKALGFDFGNINDWIYKLIDEYIDIASK